MSTNLFLITILFAISGHLCKYHNSHIKQQDYIIEIDSLNEYDLKCDLNTNRTIEWFNGDSKFLTNNKSLLLIKNLNETSRVYSCKSIATNEWNTYRIVHYEYTKVDPIQQTPNISINIINKSMHSIQILISTHGHSKRPLNLIYELLNNTRQGKQRFNSKSIKQLIRGSIHILNNNNNNNNNNNTNYHLIIDNLKTNKNYTLKLYYYFDHHQLVFLREYNISTTSTTTSSSTRITPKIINRCVRINDSHLEIDYSVDNLLKIFNASPIQTKIIKIDLNLVEFLNDNLSIIKIHTYCSNTSRCLYKVPSTNSHSFSFQLTFLNNKYSILCDTSSSHLSIARAIELKASIVDCQIISSNQLKFYIFHNTTSFSWFKIEYKLNSNNLSDFKNLNLQKDTSLQIITVNETSRDLLQIKTSKERLFLVKLIENDNSITYVIECKMSSSNIYTIFSVILGAILAILILMLGFFICFIIKKRYLNESNGYLQSFNKKKNLIFRPFGKSKPKQRNSCYIESNRMNGSCNKQHQQQQQQQQNDVFKNNYDDNSIAIDDFEQYVAQMHVDGDFGFAQLYEEICSTTRTYTFSSEVALLEQNRCKNRYTNILTYDHSRVQISCDEKDESLASDYINANYVDGYLKPNAYIATQGPMPNTFSDFWKMIWEQNCSIIVMITNVREKGRIKCDQYWPEDGSDTYGNIQVTLLHTLNLTFYTKRIFTIKLKTNKKSFRELARNSSRSNLERLVYQYQFTDWPDHGVPSSVLPVLTFIRKSSRENSEFSGPIVVHCSAGVGRTGTYIVIDSMLKQIEHKKSINIHSFLKHIRHQRNYLVQTEEQFIFIYDSLVEFLKSGETELTDQNYKQFIQKLHSLESTADDHAVLKHIDKHYKLINEFKPKEYHVSFAQMPYNRHKNRSQSIIPLNSTRVLLSKKPGVDGSEYINATYLHGCSKQDEFIITQHPMENLHANFWQMIWDNNSTHVIGLYGDDKLDNCSNYWLEQGLQMKCDSFSVILKDETFDMDFVYRDFLLQSIDEDYEFNCRVISACYWPNSCEPLKSVFDLINKVHAMRLLCSQGPIVLHDLHGSYRAATFCALYTAQEHIRLENSVNLYEIVKMYHMKRPGIWSSSAQIMFIYEAIECLFDEFMQQNLKNNSNASSSLSASTSMTLSSTNDEKINVEVPQVQQIDVSAPLKESKVVYFQYVNNLFSKTKSLLNATKQDTKNSV